jgi:isopenicillin-N N-acyltransferase-like protein
MDLPILESSGSPYAMGRRHGEAYRATIRRYAEERVRLAGSPAWTDRALPRAEVLSLARASLAAHEAYSESLSEELRGMADACDLSPEELVIVGGFTDFVDVVYNTGDRRVPAAAETAGVDDCTALLLPASRSAEGGAVLAQTWDMHEGSSEHLVLIRGRPEGAPAFLAYTTAGCVGMIGMNEAGMAVGINNVMAADGRPGVTWPFVVRRVLMQTNLDDALRVLREAPLAGGHNYLLLDAAGRGANVEAMPTHLHVTPLRAEPLAHTNHNLAPATVARQRPRDPQSQADSEARLARARELLAPPRLDLDGVMAVLSDTRAICHRGLPPRFVGTCGAVVMQPGAGVFLAVKGMPSEHPFERVAFA